MKKSTSVVLSTETQAFATLNAIIKRDSQSNFDKAVIIDYIMNTYEYSLRKVADKLGKSVGTLSDLMKSYDFLKANDLIEVCEDFDYTKISRYLRAIDKGIYSVTEHPYAEMLESTQAQVRAWENEVEREKDKLVDVYNKRGKLIAKIPSKLLAKYAV